MLISQSIHVGVGRGLQHRQSREKNEDSQQVHREAEEGADVIGQHGGIEEESTRDTESQSQQHTRFVGMFLDKNRPRQCKKAISQQIADHLDPCCLGIGEAHDAFECRQHRIGHVVGYRPDEKEGC